jgi:hypothetical protein
MMRRSVRRNEVVLPPPPKEALTLTSWVLLLADLGLLGGSGMLMEDASRIFDCAQLPEAVETEGGQRQAQIEAVKRSDHDADTVLSFIEFQEAVIAVAVFVTRDPTTPLHTRIHLVLDAALPEAHLTEP